VMRTRIVIGCIIIILVAAMFWLDLLVKQAWQGYFICVVAMVVTGAALQELFAMAEKADLKPFRFTGIAFGSALLPYYLWSDILPGLLGPQAFVAFIMAPILALILVLMGRACTRPEGLTPQLRNIAVTVFGVLYVALPMSFLVRTRFLNEGWDLVVLVIGVTKASDVGAYFGGTLFGRHKLAPLVSPNKTVEGAIGGIVASALVSVAMVYPMAIHTLTDRGLLATISFGVVVGVASQLGDFTESLIKRSTNTKDSGTVLPSFGGVLDVIDSFLVAAPVAYFVLSIFAKVTVQLSRT